MSSVIDKRTAFDLFESVSCALPAGEVPVGTRGVVVDEPGEGFYMVEWFNADGETLVLSTVPGDILTR
jgi:hypothetical protein